MGIKNRTVLKRAIFSYPSEGYKPSEGFFINNFYTNWLSKNNLIFEGEVSIFHNRRIRE
jgi:hypothetical protein